MSAHVLLNLFNELGIRDKMRANRTMARLNREVVVLDHLDNR